MGEVEQKFEELLRQKNHKEIIGLLNKMLMALSKEQTAPDMIVDTTEMERVIRTLNSNSKLDEIPTAVKLLGEALVNKIEAIKNTTPKEWMFDIQRNKQGLINKVNAKAK